MFAYANQYFPFIVFGLCGLTMFSRRPNEQDSFPTWLYLFLMVGFLQPWICINYFRNNDLWLLSIQALTAVLLMVVRRNQLDDESWFKGSVSLLFGLLFLHVSQHPTLGLPFPLSTEWVQCLTAAAAAVGIFLLFGLPPLQLGVVDMGSERSTKLQMPLQVVYRFVLGFFFLAHIQGTAWLESIHELHPLLIGALLVGLGFSRVVLRLQTNPYRTVSYLAGGFVLAVAAGLLDAEYGALVLIGTAVAFMPFFTLLNIPSPDGTDGKDLWNVTSFRSQHPRPAAHFFVWLKVYLGLEALVCAALAVKLGILGYYGTAVLALFALLAALSVIGDKEAFQSRVQPVS